MSRRLPVVVTAGLVALAGCGTGGGALRQAPPSRFAAEPQKAPATSVAPLGTVLAVGDTPEGVVISDVLNEAVVALRRPDSLVLVDLGGRHAISRLATPGRARHLRLLAAAGPLLLAAEDVDALFEVALPSGTVAARFPTGRQPHDAVFVGGRVWVTDELAGSVTALGPGGRTFPAGLQPGGIAAAGGRVAAADVRGNRLYVFDAKTLREVAVLPAGAGPTHVVQVGINTVAVADTRGGAIMLYALSGRPRLLARLVLRGGPYGMAADLQRHRLWVALSGRNQLVRVDVGLSRLTDSGVRLPTVRQPNSVAVGAAGDLVVAGATSDGTIELLGRR